MRKQTIRDVDVRGKHDDRGLRKLGADHAGCLEPFPRMRRRHPDVDDRELGSMLANELEQLAGVTTPTDDGEAGPLEEAGNPLAQQHVVVRNDNPSRGLGHAVKYGGALRAPGYCGGWETGPKRSTSSGSVLLRSTTYASQIEPSKRAHIGKSSSAVVTGSGPGSPSATTATRK